MCGISGIFSKNKLSDSIGMLMRDKKIDEANEIKSIKSQFGTKSRVKRDNFIPEIIKKHL